MAFYGKDLPALHCALPARFRLRAPTITSRRFYPPFAEPISPGGTRVLLPPHSPTMPTARGRRRRGRGLYGGFSSSSAVRHTLSIVLLVYVNKYTHQHCYSGHQSKFLHAPYCLSLPHRSFPARASSIALLLPGGISPGHSIYATLRQLPKAGRGLFALGGRTNSLWETYGRAA